MYVKDILVFFLFVSLVFTTSSCAANETSNQDFSMPTQTTVLIPTIEPPLPVIDKENEWINTMDVKEVFEMSTNFIHLGKFLEKEKEYLSWYWFESAIGISDADHVTLVQTVQNDASFIVSFNNEYYINKTIAENIAKQAKINHEKRINTYYVGDVIEIFTGYGEQQSFCMSFLIRDVTVSYEEDSSSALFTIDLVVDSGISGANPISDYIDYIETENGSIYTGSSMDVQGKVSFRFPKSDRIEYIYLTGNEYAIMRKVRVDPVSVPIPIFP